MSDQGRLLAAFHRLDWHPRCCQDGCSRMAEHTILDADDLTRPQCRRHLDDLGSVPRSGGRLTYDLGHQRG